MSSAQEYDTIVFGLAATKVCRFCWFAVRPIDVVLQSIQLACGSSHDSVKREKLISGLIVASATILMWDIIVTLDQEVTPFRILDYPFFIVFLQGFDGVECEVIFGNNTLFLRAYFVKPPHKRLIYSFSESIFAHLHVCSWTYLYGTYPPDLTLLTIQAFEAQLSYAPSKKVQLLFIQSTL